MGINVNYAPDIRLLGDTALAIGQGEAAQRDRQQQQAQQLAMAELGERARQFDAARISRENSQIFGHGADLNRMAFGAGLQGQQAQFEMRAREAQIADQQAFQIEQMERAAKIDKQMALDRMSMDGQKAKAQMDRELEVISSADLLPHQKELAMQQHQAKWGGFDPAVYAIPEGHKPGDIITDSGYRYRVDPSGKIQKIGDELLPPEEDFARKSFVFNDPITKKPTLWLKDSRGGWQRDKPTDAGELADDALGKLYLEAKKGTKAYDGEGNEIEPTAQAVNDTFMSMLAAIKAAKGGPASPADFQSLVQQGNNQPVEEGPPDEQRAQAEALLRSILRGVPGGADIPLQGSPPAAPAVPAAPPPPPPDQVSFAKSAPLVSNKQELDELKAEARAAGLKEFQYIGPDGKTRRIQL